MLGGGTSQSLLRRLAQFSGDKHFLEERHGSTEEFGPKQHNHWQTNRLVTCDPFSRNRLTPGDERQAKSEA